MKILRFVNLFIILVMIAALLPSGQAAAAPVPPTGAPPDLFVPGEIIVGFHHGANLAQAQVEASALANEIGAQVVEVRTDSYLLRAAPSSDVPQMVARAKQAAGVRFAEPNYYYRVPESDLASAPSQNTGMVRTIDPNGKVIESSRAYKQQMRTIKNGNRVRLYPNDPSLWNTDDLWGWWAVNASVIWPDITPSKNVCVIDTGVDYTHKDLIGRIIKGRDFVNDDLNPMDDFGHGTHVAGIITAVTNNAEGITGVSNAKVVAVKALDAQGKGSSWEIAEAIRYCNSLTGASKVDVINMSLGGVGYSTYIEDAVAEAMAANKVIVASAGNDDVFSYNNCTDLRLYPAGFAEPGYYVDPNTCQVDLNYPIPGYDNVLSVGAFDQNWDKAVFSNYGSWVHWAAPGVGIRSTLPWDKPFALNYWDPVSSPMRYGSLDGTSMAAPFLSAIVARSWGYQAKSNPSLPYYEAVNKVKDTSWSMTDTQRASYGWPPEQGELLIPDLAAAMDRMGITVRAWDALTSVPLKGAVVNAYDLDTNLVKGSPAVITAYTDSWADIINLPAGGLVDGYRLKISLSGYTASPQEAFVSPYHVNGFVPAGPGFWAGSDGTIRAAVPPASANFTAVTAWTSPDYVDFDLATSVPADFINFLFYIVAGKYGPGNDFGLDAGETTGYLPGYPFARASFVDDMFWEAHVIKARPGVPALPYLKGDYNFHLTSIHTIMSMDTYQEALFLWKSGVLVGPVNAYGSKRVNRTCSGGSYWNALRMTSGASGVPTYVPINACNDLQPTYP